MLIARPLFVQRYLTLIFAVAFSFHLAGCVSPVERLPSELESPEHRALGELADQLPETLIRVPVRESDGGGHHLALHESVPPGAVPARRIVFLHGVLSDSRMWRYQRGELGRDHLITTVDLLGCGSSDAPDASDLPPDGYGPSAHAGRVLQALRQRLALDPPDTRVTLVGHSLGGTIILRMYADDALARGFRDVLDRVDSAVLFTPVDVEFSKENPEMSSFGRASELAMCMAGFLGVFDQRAYELSLSGVSDPRLAIREEARRFAQILHDPPRRRAAQAMIRQFVSMKDAQPDRTRIDEIVRGYARVRIPVLLVWGRQDPTLPLSMGQKLAAQLPRARLHVIPHAMHSVPSECPGEAIRLIREMAAAP